MVGQGHPQLGRGDPPRSPSVVPPQLLPIPHSPTANTPALPQPPSLLAPPRPRPATDAPTWQPTLQICVQCQQRLPRPAAFLINFNAIQADLRANHSSPAATGFARPRLSAPRPPSTPSSIAAATPPTPLPRLP